MPIKHAAFKALRQSTKRREKNLAIKTNLKKVVKSVRKAVAAKDAAKSKELLTTAIKTIDRAAQKGVIKKNTAARLKSRLHKAVSRV